MPDREWKRVPDHRTTPSYQDSIARLLIDDRDVGPAELFDEGHNHLRLVHVRRDGPQEVGEPLSVTQRRACREEADL